MESRHVTVNVTIDGKTFRKFTIFDNIYLRRRWISPVVFAVIFSVCACVCFAMRDRAEHAAMLGCVLLLVGLGLPAVHMRAFFRSIKSQIKIHRLENPRPAYSLIISDAPDGIRVANPGGESARYEWGGLFMAYRVDGCVYLYVASNKAFLLPDGQAEEGADCLWALLSDMLPAEKLRDLRKTKGVLRKA